MRKLSELGRFLGRRSCILPAQGNAPGTMNQTIPDSAQQANLSRSNGGFLQRHLDGHYNHFPTYYGS
jgi:hypothetical protein